MPARTVLLTSAAFTLTAVFAHAQTLDFSSASYPAATGARDAVVLDVNRDGWPDLATANTGRNSVVILENRGEGNGFQPAREIAVDGQSYAIGTTSGLAINLEECSGCGVSNWGWEDDGWGAVNRQGVTVRFPEGGRRHLRIQVREDGVSVDQIVFSAVKYRTSRPGTAKNDIVIVPDGQ